MKISIKVILLSVATVIGFSGVVFWLGLINIGASTGHWAVTDWVLHTAMKRSVSFRAREEAPANFPSPAMVRRGAAHYEAACSFCHGSPMAFKNVTVQEMTPEPPELTSKVQEWRANELFWIVQNGIKFTGMPAWPAPARKDEIWSVVAFLQLLPQMSPEEYETLAFGELAKPSKERKNLGNNAKLAYCIRCHGVDGKGEENGAFPRLDIQNKEYLAYALESYVKANRQSGIMEHAAGKLSDSEIDQLAAYFSSNRYDREIVQPQNKPPEELLSRGKKIAEHGIAKDDVAACSGCHGANDDRRAEFPTLNGQYRSYLQAQLRQLAKDQDRGGGNFNNLMLRSVHSLKSDDIEAVAAWYSSRHQKD